MIYESGLVFGRHAKEINEAYAKMYEAEDGFEADANKEVTAEDLGNDGLGVFGRRHEVARKWPSWLTAAVNKAKEEGKVVNLPNIDDEPIVNLDDAAAEQEDAGELGDEEVSYMGDEEVEFDDDEELVSDDASDTSTEEETDWEDEDDEEGGLPEENWWNSTIAAHPEIFNDDEYDMGQLELRKKEIMDGAMKVMSRGVSDEVVATQRALEEIPGCKCKTPEEPRPEGEEEDVVGNIDK